MLHAAVYATAFAFVLTEQPTRIGASEWISEHIPQDETVFHAPEVLFNWLLPEVDMEVGDEAAEWVLILMPDLEVFQKYRKHPQKYQKQDWYPLNAVALEDTLEFYERVLGEGSPYLLHKTFQYTQQFLGIQISDSGAPFPIRALAHPEIRIYQRRN